jgi:HK97 family phage prohead protease
MRVDTKKNIMALSDPITFIVSDESVNRYGFRVLTDGINTAEFEQNPVMFWNHRSDTDGWAEPEGERLPIGRWENIRKENGQLLADAVLDLDDELGAKVHRKVTEGVISAASIGFRIVATSNDAEAMEPGQTRETITESNLLEISIVDIPANAAAMKLRGADNQVVNLSADNMENIDELLPVVEAVEETTEETPEEMTEETPAPTMAEVVTNALNSFISKLRESFKLVPKDDTQDGAQVVADLFAELNTEVTVQLNIQHEKQNDDLAQLRADIETMKAERKEATEMEQQIADLKAEVAALSVGKSGGLPPAERKPITEQKENTPDPMRQALNAFGARGALFLHKND